MEDSLPSSSNPYLANDTPPRAQIFEAFSCIRHFTPDFRSSPPARFPCADKHSTTNSCRQMKDVIRKRIIAPCVESGHIGILDGGFVRLKVSHRSL